MPMLAVSTWEALRGVSGLQWLVVPLIVLGAYQVTWVRLPPGASVPLMRNLLPYLGIPVALVLIAALGAVVAIDMTWFDLAGVTVVALFAAIVGQLVARCRRSRPERLGVIGSASVAAALETELRAIGAPYHVAGYVDSDTGAADSVSDARDSRLGTISDVAEVVEGHDLDLLLVAPNVSRLLVFEEVSAIDPELPVHVMDLSLFYEQVFGHVPLTLINASWFQYVMHPAYSTRIPAAKRTADVCLALVLGLFLAPVIGVLAVLIRRDGGPVFYRQPRVGEGGREFLIYKLRSMTVSAVDCEQRWSSAGDKRVTRLGRVLRHTHLDETPQLLNVLRGEMTLVGPRPEQPAVVARLERTIPYYSRRHLVRPGITGWAQVQCGYAGSVAGSAAKLAHDLYYLKHRSMSLDLLILGETVRTVFRDRQWSAGSVSHVLVPMPRNEADAEG